MSLDPTKWSEALKTAITTAGVYKLALAAVCGFYWFAASQQVILAAANWEIRVAAFGLLLFGLLWIANVVSAVVQFFPPAPWLIHFITVRREAAFVRAYIPSMTAQERAIIGYLLARKQKLFIAAQDGGYAMPLISQRIVRLALQEGQVFSEENTPMVIPDHVWKVLVAHKDQFPYTPPSGRGVEPEPWRIPWMVR